MRYIRQFAIILAVSCAGELLHLLIPIPVPASIYGLVLMFVLLLSGLVKLPAVRETAEFLIEIMPLMFIPAVVGLIVSWDVLRPVLIPVLVTTVVSTFLVMAVAGHVTQAMMRSGKTKAFGSAAAGGEASDGEEAGLHE